MRLGPAFARSDAYSCGPSLSVAAIAYAPREVGLELAVRRQLGGDLPFNRDTGDLPLMNGLPVLEPQSIGHSLEGWVVLHQVVIVHTK